MAEKRMFSKKITDSDAFLEMPLSSQCLYFHLNMNADDDGFVNNPKRTMRVIGASEDDLKILITKAFVLVFESGVIVIKHWRMNNTLRADRYKPTDYQEEYMQLGLKDNKSYTRKPNGNQLEPQYRLDKNRLDKNSIDIEIKHKHGQYKNVLLSDEEFEKLKQEFPNDYQQRIERVSEYCASSGKSYKNYLATIRNWARKDNPSSNESLPTYDDSINKTISDEDENEILKMMGKI